jgi:hypothetical protein
MKKQIAEVYVGNEYICHSMIKGPFFLAWHNRPQQSEVPHFSGFQNAVFRHLTGTETKNNHK